MRRLVIAGRVVDDDSEAWVIAEIGHNHQGKLAHAKQLIELVAAAGAEAVKLQKRDNRSLYTRAYYERPYSSEDAFAPTYGAHREALEFDWDQYGQLQLLAQDRGLVFFATPFDPPSVEFLARLEVPCLKIASGCLTDTGLIEQAAAVGVPLLISTGGAQDLTDVQRAYGVARRHLGADQVAVLQCTALYPCPYSELDLRVIETYRRELPEAVIGLSSHDMGIFTGAVAYALGARVFERHLTSNQVIRGNDHAFSLTPVGLRNLVQELRNTRLALGQAEKRRHEGEQEAVHKMGKSLYSARELEAGHVLRAEDIAVKSPGGFLPPYFAPALVGWELGGRMVAEEPFHPHQVRTALWHWCGVTGERYPAELVGPGDQV